MPSADEADELSFERDIKPLFRTKDRDSMQQAFDLFDYNDVVENDRDWNGYRLNPLVVKLVAWEQEMVATPKSR